jgi:ferric-dicitrate binding protein FerR (iron transport regulator)
MKHSKGIGRLLFKYLQGKLTVEEAIILEQWKEQSEENRLFLEELSRGAASQRFGAPQPLPDNLEERIFSKISAQIPALKGGVVKMRHNWWKYAASAAAVLVLIVSGFFMLSTPPREKNTAKAETINATDVPAPEANYASITLADGKKLDLNNSSGGTLASQGEMELIKTADGLIVYKAATGNRGNAIQWNTLTNPKGSNVIGMVLEDGTKVWLNAGSSLTYPVAFIGTERKVTITGEAYFEVTKNKLKPFKVTRDKMEVEVLGTHFNVNAYGDQPFVKVTLLEGAVKVNNGNTSGLLKPGQQANIGDNKINVRSDINVDQVMAWKNGYFSFDKATAIEVMQELSRWYNIEVVYEGQVPDQLFGGELRRNSKLSSVLKILEKSGVNFRIDGTKVIVHR